MPDYLSVDDTSDSSEGSSNESHVNTVKYVVLYERHVAMTLPDWWYATTLVSDASKDEVAWSGSGSGSKRH